MLQDIDSDYLHTWGHYRTLVELHRRIRGRITDPALNVRHLGSLGLCLDQLGEYRRAIELCTQALAVARIIGYRYVEANALELYRTGMAGVGARSGLARVHLQLGDAAAALALTSVERELTFPPVEPEMHLLEGLALLEPARTAEAVQAFARARAVTSAPGRVADTRRLLGIVTAHDHSGILAALDPD